MTEPRIVLCVVGNGRSKYLQHAVASAARFLQPIYKRVMVNDTGDAMYAKYLDDQYPEYDMRVHHDQNQGMAAAVNAAWSAALMYKPDFVFHLEEDFVLREPIPLLAMAEHLNAHPDVASITLKRPPWAGKELELGDQLAAIIDASTEHEWSSPVTYHNHIFSLNPSLIPVKIIERGWPSGPLGVGNESGMTDMLLKYGYRFSVWGQVSDAPLCEHIGLQRGDHWQL